MSWSYTIADIYVIQNSSVSVPASTTSGAGTANSNSFTPIGSAKVYVLLNLPSGVTATANIGSQTFPLSTGLNTLIVPPNTTFYVTFSNSNTSASTVYVIIIAVPLS